MRIKGIFFKEIRSVQKQTEHINPNFVRTQSVYELFVCNAGNINLHAQPRHRSESQPTR